MSTSLEIAPPESQAEFYDRFLDHFIQQRNNARCKDAIQWALRWVRPGYKVLEIGCGIGDISAALGNAGADVLGLDLSPRVIDWAKSNQEAPGVKYLCADARTANFHAEGPFDMVVFSDSIEHIPAVDRPGVVAAVCRAMKPEKAVALIAWPNPCIHARATQSTYQPVDERVETDQLVAEFRTGGFNFVNYIQSCMGGVYMKAVIQKVPEHGAD